ncbi:hypothetical protein F5Y15DRAFT_368230 [Xylariaceae sp. FL0016]|nr:hypothetical protein F5Y15DRAFT_368230 [Xylariaceae sp. FL0016]
MRSQGHSFGLLVQVVCLDTCSGLRFKIGRIEQQSRPALEISDIPPSHQYNYFYRYTGGLLLSTKDYLGRLQSSMHHFCALLAPRSTSKQTSTPISRSSCAPVTILSYQRKSRRLASLNGLHSAFLHIGNGRFVLFETPGDLLPRETIHLVRILMFLLRHFWHAHARLDGHI